MQRVALRGAVCVRARAAPCVSALRSLAPPQLAHNALALELAHRARPPARKYYDLVAYERYAAAKAAHDAAAGAGKGSRGKDVGAAGFDARADEEAMRRARMDARLKEQQDRLAEAYNLLKHTDRAKDMREQEVRARGRAAAAPGLAACMCARLPRMHAASARLPGVPLTRLCALPLYAAPLQLLRAEMALAYKTGDRARADKIFNRLQPDEPTKKK